MSAEKAVEEGQTAVVITNGCRQGDVILDVIRGRPIGTLITQSAQQELAQSVDIMADQGKLSNHNVDIYICVCCFSS